MDAEVYEDALELTVPILEAVLPDSEQYLSTAYPYPSLRITGRSERRRFRTIVLENPYLRVVVVPDLGGRILRIFDKRTNTDIFPDEPLTPIESGSRGVEIAQGIQVRYTPQDRPNSLGTVNYQPVQAVDDEDDAGVWIGEVSKELSFNALISLPSNAAEIKIEMRMFNRMIGDTSYNGGISIHLPQAVLAHAQEERTVTGEFIAYASNHGLSIRSESYPEPSLWTDGDRVSMHRFFKSTPSALSARQLDTWRLTLRPHSGLSWPVVSCGAGALAATETGYAFQATRPVSSCKLEIRTNEWLEAPLAALPEQIVNFPFPNRASVTQLLIYCEAEKMYVGSFASIPEDDVFSGPRKKIDGVAESLSKIRADINEMDDVSEEVKSLLPGYRYEGYLEHAIPYVNAEKRDEVLEQALLYNGEDHLAWWIKGASRRAENVTTEEMAEILNAHYLAPLEPALRAEGFLNQSQTQGRQPNPILKPLNESPEQFVDVACHLLEWRLYKDAARFIDEALRHMDLPMLRYLYAHALRENSKMEVEAAAHVQQGSAKPLGPPFPWRQIELDALRRLAMKFKDDARLKQYLEIAERRRPSK